MTDERSSMPDESRQQQGLPPTVTDRVVLRRLAALLTNNPIDETRQLVSAGKPDERAT